MRLFKRRSQKVSFTIDIISLLNRLDAIEKENQRLSQRTVELSNWIANTNTAVTTVKQKQNYIQKFGDLYQEE